MGIGDMHSNGFDADASRYERENRLNPAEFAPGQDATFQQDIFATSSVPANTGEMGDIFGSGAGGEDIFGGQNDIFGGQGGNSFDAFGGAGDFIHTLREYATLRSLPEAAKRIASVCLYI